MSNRRNQCPDSVAVQGDISLQSTVYSLQQPTVCKLPVLGKSKQHSKCARVAYFALKAEGRAADSRLYNRRKFAPALMLAILPIYSYI